MKALDNTHEQLSSVYDLCLMSERGEWMPLENISHSIAREVVPFL